MSLFVLIALETIQPPSHVAGLLSIAGKIEDDGRVSGTTPGGSFLVAQRGHETRNYDIARDGFGIDYSVRVSGAIGKENPSDEVRYLIHRIPALYAISHQGGYIQYLDNPMVRWIGRTIEISRSSYYVADLRETLLRADLGTLVVEVDFDPDLL